MDSPMVKAHLITMSFNQMISSITKGTGKMACPTAQVKLITTMEMSIKDISLTDKDKVMVHMYSIKFIDMKVNGKIILSQVKVNFSEMGNSFSRDSSKMVSSMDLESTNTKMVTILKETISRMRKEEKENIIFMKVVFCNLNSIQPLHKFREFS